MYKLIEFNSSMSKLIATLRIKCHFEFFCTKPPSHISKKASERWYTKNLIEECTLRHASCSTSDVPVNKTSYTPPNRTWLVQKQTAIGEEWLQTINETNKSNSSWGQRNNNNDVMKKLWVSVYISGKFK